MRRIAVVLLPLLLVLGVRAEAQPTVSDPEVAKGIQLVQDGDYEEAIIILDSAVRRLAATQKPSSDLAEAYLYLGVAYLAKGHETSAKAQFREALARTKDLRLTTDKFAPRVIELFEKAREEAGKTTASAPVPTPPPPVSPPQAKKGGSNKTIILVGVGVAAAAGVGIAVAGGGGGGTAAASPPAEPEFRDAVIGETPGPTAPCAQQEWVVRPQPQPMEGTVAGITLRVAGDRGFLQLAGPTSPPPPQGVPIGDVPPGRTFAADATNNAGLASFIGMRSNGDWRLEWRPAGLESGKDRCAIDSWELRLHVRRP